MYITLGMRIINIFVFFKKEVTVIGGQDRNARSGRRVREYVKGIYNIVFHEKCLNQTVMHAWCVSKLLLYEKFNSFEELIF